MDFQTQINAILEKRKVELVKLENEQKRISAIKAELEKISGSVRKLKDVNKFSEQLERINTAINNLTEAENKSKTLYNRFTRDSINIGMAGEARVGKSTILQTITGLSDEQIPTGSGEPVTAVHSRIFNIPAGEKPYALIQFHTSESFFEKRIKPYLDALKETGNEIKVNSFADFETYDFSKISVSPSDSDNLEKIKSAQEALHRYKNLLGAKGTRIDDMSMLIKYVSYPRTEKGEKKNQDSVYWAVSSAEIYCHFPSL